MSGNGSLSYFSSNGFEPKNCPLSYIEIPMTQEGGDVFIYYRNFDS